MFLLRGLKLYGEGVVEWNDLKMWCESGYPVSGLFAWDHYYLFVGVFRQLRRLRFHHDDRVCDRGADELRH
jgi:hypothetical protein